MLLIRASGTELASRPIAVALAEMVFKEIYGEAEFQAQAPLRGTDDDDRWRIEGSREPAHDPSARTMKGRLEIIIVKVNCQIVRLTQKVHFAPSPPA